MVAEAEAVLEAAWVEVSSHSCSLLKAAAMTEAVAAPMLVKQAEAAIKADVTTESAIIALLRELRAEGHIMLVSMHNLGSVPEFCDHVVLINRTVLAAGLTSEVFTEENLLRTFGGVLRHFRFDESTVQKHDGRTVTLLTDDERPLVFGKGGHVEYSKREGREDVVKKRAEGAEDV
jgi:manganese/iron transport system ATP-binding protein